MKKILIIFLIFFLLLSYNCKKKETQTIEVIETPTSEIEVVEEDDSVEKTTDDYEVIIKYLSKLASFEQYEINETGTTKAEKGFIKYTQEITCQTKKLSKNEYYYHNNSSSTFVTTDHTATFSGDMVTYHNKDSEDTTTTLSEYRKDYGVSPNDGSLMGFIISKDTVLSITREKIDDNYLFTINLDGEKAGNNTKIQTKTFGDLKDYPIYESVTLQLTIKNDFTPIKCDINSKYEISVVILGSMTCNQELHDTFSNIKSS